MKLRATMRVAALGFGLGLLALPAAAQVAPDHPGRAVYNKSCATCHDNPGTTRAATLASMQQQAPARLREVLTTGVMAPMAASLSPKEITDVIAFLTAGQAAAPATWTDALMCAADKRGVSSSATIVAAGFGENQPLEPGNTDAKAGLDQIADYFEQKAKAAFDRGYYSGSMVLAEQGLRADESSDSLKRLRDDSRKAAGL